MNLDHDFVQVWKFSEDKRKMQIEHFFSSNSGEDQKKRKKKVFFKNRTLFLPDFRWRPKKKEKVFCKNTTLFFPNLRSAVHPFKLLGGMQMWTILKLLGGIQPNYWGDISPHSPGFLQPWWQIDLKTERFWLLAKPSWWILNKDIYLYSYNSNCLLNLPCIKIIAKAFSIFHHWSNVQLPVLGCECKNEVEKRHKNSSLMLVNFHYWPHKAYS